MGVSVGGCFKQIMVFRERERERKRWKVAVGLRSGECKAGYETNKICDLRDRWRKLCALREGEQDISVLRWVLRT